MGVLLLCEKCGRSDEIEDVRLDHLLRETAARAGFAPHRQMVELLGLCRECAAEAGDGAAAAPFHEKPLTALQDGPA